MLRRWQSASVLGFGTKRPPANAVLTTAVDAKVPLTRRLTCSGGLWWTRVDPKILLKIGRQVAGVIGLSGRQ